MNASFFGYFAAGGAFVQAKLNQPFRFGDVSGSTVEMVLNMYSLTNLVAGVALSPGLDYPDGYLTNTDASSNQYLFLLPGYFDPTLLDYAEETKQPVTTGELLTIGSLPPVNAFAGPVLVIAGCESDLDASREEPVLTSFQRMTYHSVVAIVSQPATHRCPLFLPPWQKDSPRCLPTTSKHIFNPILDME